MPVSSAPRGWQVRARCEPPPVGGATVGLAGSYRGTVGICICSRSAWDTSHVLPSNNCPHLDTACQPPFFGVEFMPIDPRLVTIPNTNPPLWVLYAHAVLLRAVAQGDETQIAAWCAWAGGATFRFFAATESILSNFCLITDGLVGIGVFAGTRNLTQLVAQIAGSAMANDPAIPANVSTFDLVYADSVTALARSTIPPTLRNAPVLITGHSLGGAIAELLAARRIDGAFTNVSLLTFGQPRTGDSSLAARAPANYVRVVNQGDPVAGIPPRPLVMSMFLERSDPALAAVGYSHGGAAWLITPDGVVPTTDAETGTDLGSMALSLGTGMQYQTGVEQFHSLGTYAWQLYGHSNGQTGNPDLTGVLNISRTLQGNPPPSPSPADAPVVPPLPPTAAVASSTFVPTPYPGHLPLDDRGLPIELIEVAGTVIPPPGATSLFSGVQFMATLSKVTFFYQQLNQGFQESYYCQAATIGAAQAIAEPLGTALLTLRGENTAIISYRVSLVDVPLQFPRLRQARNFPPLPNWRAGSFVNAPPGVPPENWSDMFSVCVLMRGVPATVGQPGKNIYMRGLPDSYDVRGGLLAGTLDQFFGMARVQALQRALVPAGTPFGWLGTIRPVVAFQSPLTAVTQNANGTITMTLAAAIATFPAGALGNAQNFVPIRLTGMRQPGNLNGTIPVRIDSTGFIVTTKKRIAIGQWDNSTGTVSYIPKSFIPFSGGIISAPVRGNPMTYGNLWAVRISERKAGKIYGTVPGRRPNRVRA